MRSSVISTIYAPQEAAREWRLEELLGCPARYYSFGRVALARALELAGVMKGDSVLFPELICREAVAAARALGAVPAYYPVGDKLDMAADPASLHPARAIVAVDYFGFSQDLGPFRSYAARTGAAIIEDNAHGLFSRDAQGHWLGARSDIGIFSLRKTLALPNGAALVLPPGSPWALPPQIEFKSAASTVYRLKQGLRKSVPIIGLRPLRVLLAARRRMTPHHGEVIDGEKQRSLPPPHPCLELAQPLSAADPAQEAERRRALYRFVEPRVTALGGNSVFSALVEGVAPYVYPFRAEAAPARAIVQALSQAGLDCFSWPELPEEVARRDRNRYADIWCVRFLW